MTLEQFPNMEVDFRKMIVVATMLITLKHEGLIVHTAIQKLELEEF